MISDNTQNQTLDKTTVMQSVLKESDLRKDNLIYWKGEVIKVDLEILTKLFGNNNYPDSLKLNFKPIPLTEDWLLKFGFKIEKQYQCDFASIGVFTISFGDNFFYDYTNLKYVHQLQNLYYAITQRELTVA